MAQAAIELDAPFLDHVEDVLFTYERGAGGFGCFSCAAFGVGDHADAHVGLDGVGEAHAVADDGAVFERLEADMELVFGGGRIAAYFGGAKVAEEGMLAFEHGTLETFLASVRVPHGINQAELQRISKVGRGI